MLQKFSPLSPYLHKNKIALSLFLLYMAATIYLSIIHIPWRDEVRALSIAMSSSSINQLMANTHNEGHPLLWYIILFIAYHLFHQVVVLKIASVIIALAAIYIFLTQSPFSWIQKALFIFGYFPLYEYSIKCRNYGLSMLFIFLFCCVYQKRFEKPLLLGLILFLLANTHAYALLMTVAILFSLMAEAFTTKRNLLKDPITRDHLITGFLIIISGILFSIITSFPVQSFLGVSIKNLSILSILKTTFSSLLYPQEYFAQGLGMTQVGILIWLMIVVLWRNPFLLIIFLIFPAGVFICIEYVLPKDDIRLQGFLYLLMIALLWIEMNSKTLIDGIYSKVFFWGRKCFIYALLILQLPMAYWAVYQETQLPFSNSKNLSLLIKGNPKLKDAIIVCEKDTLIESLPYYADNRIFIPRENRFGKTASMSIFNKQDLSLQELLNTAVTLKEKYHKPVIIVLWYKINLDKNGPYLIQYLHGSLHHSNFTYSRKQLASFEEKTVKIASFLKSICEERYNVYLLK